MKACTISVLLLAVALALCENVQAQGANDRVNLAAQVSMVLFKRVLLSMRPI